MPIGTTTALLLAGAAAGSAGAIGQGIMGARAAKAMGLTDAQRRELEELERRRQTGEFLPERQRQSMEQRFLAEQAGVQRQLEASALQQAAARAGGGPVSGRDVFLQEQAEQLAGRQIRQEQNTLLQQAEQAARLEQAARIDAMRAQEQQAAALRAQAVGQAISGVSGALQSAALQQAGQAFQLDLAASQLGVETDEQLTAKYPSPSGYSFGGKIP